MDIAQLLMAKKAWDVKCISPSSTLRETAETLLKHRVGALVVADASNKMVGIVSERDLVQVVASRDPEAANVPVSQVMTRKVISCTSDDEVAFILRLMNEHGIRHMPVLEHGELVGMLSIRELTTAYEMLQVEASTDPLTRVSNRRTFIRTLRQECSKARRYDHPLAVAMLDIDHFKKVNDTHGHDAGDRVLRAISAMIVSEFRSIDFVGRMGGEEFAMVFPETTLAGAKIACERLVTNIRSARIPANHKKISITVSIGVAEASTKVPEGADLLKRADELLYVAKNNGRDRIVVEGD